jgi:hypothetical protein
MVTLQAYFTGRPMIRLIKLPVAAGFALLLAAGSAPSAGAQGAAAAQDRPVSPAHLEGIAQQYRVDAITARRFNHDQFWRAVGPFVSRPALAAADIGSSMHGRAIRAVRFGNGPTTVLLWSQMHGDESTATMSLADIVRFFDESSDHPLARRIAEGSTVHMIPMLNPDGAERFRRRNAQGVDVNRDARALQTPEGRLLKAVRDRVEPDFGFNLHDQSAAVRVGQSSRGVAIALLAPAFNAARDVDDKRRRAMQVATLLIEAMDPLVGDHIAKYDDTFNPRAFGDLMGAWGASTVLIESGAWEDDPQKQHLRKTNFVGILTALDAIATGRYSEYDPEVYERLEFNGRRLTDLLVAGGTIAVPGLPHLVADLLVDYRLPLLKEDGLITDLGDMGGVEAQDTLRVDGLYLIPTERALGENDGLDVGAPAHFVVAEDPDGRRVRFVFEGRLPN